MTSTAWISTEAIDLHAMLARVDAPAHGAVASFVGQVRDHDPEAQGRVVGLRYSCHPDAQTFIEDIVARTVAQHDPQDVTDVAATHRIGDLDVGDLALVVVVGSAHRDLAFTLCRAVVEAIKHELPVWKQQFEADGSHVWSGLNC
jgi:molybdopterin synthase catalytic subunit